MVNDLSVNFDSFVNAKYRSFLIRLKKSLNAKQFHYVELNSNDTAEFDNMVSIIDP